jgi:hypothetical protein
VLDEGRGHQYLTIGQGFADVSGRWVVSHQWSDWESEVIWMTLYFSIAVWLSIGLMHTSMMPNVPQKYSRLENDGTRLAAKSMRLRSPISL